MARDSERQEEREGESSGSPPTQRGEGVSAREAYWQGRRKAPLLSGEVGRWEEIAGAAAVAIVAVAAGAVAVAGAGAAGAGDGIVAAGAEAVVR